MIKLEDVAKFAKVSTATVSLVLNNRPGVSAKTREKIIRVVSDLGYMPNRMARGLAMRKSKTIGLVITDIENPFFGSVTRYMDAFVKGEGYGMVLAISNDKLDEEDMALGDFIGDMVEGIVIVPTLGELRTDFTIFSKLDRLKIPYVFLTSYYPNFTAHSVITDLMQGSYMLATHLIELGHSDIVCLIGESTRVTPAALRIAGFKKALRDNGLAFDTKMIVKCKMPSYQSGYETMLALLKTRVPHAIMAMNDILALGARKALSERSFSVPDDVAIAGFDDVIYASICDVPLTTVRQNIPKMCRLAVTELLRLIDAGDHEVRKMVTHYVAPELVVRRSTRKDEVGFSASGDI